MGKGLLVFSALAIALATVHTADLARAEDGNEGNAYGHCKTWNLATDYAAGPDGPLPVYPDACGRSVWYLSDSVTLSYDPADYSLLPIFIDFATACDPGTGLKSWSSGGNFTAPHVGLNTLSIDQACDPWAPITWLAGTVNVHPAPGSAAVVGWRSPVGGHVSVAVDFNDFDPWGGDGVDWFVQKNGVTLASGVIPNGESANWQSAKLKVMEGDFLYFGVGPGPNGEYSYDSTRLEVTIAH